MKHLQTELLLNFFQRIGLRILFICFDCFVVGGEVNLVFNLFDHSLTDQIGNAYIIYFCIIFDQLGIFFRESLKITVPWEYMESSFGSIVTLITLP